jgi:restriction system protein
MARIWGIHNDQSLDLVEGSFVSIGWSELGDLSGQTFDRASLKERLASAFPEAKAGALPVWAGVLSRFMYDIEIGDLVVSPDRKTRTINIGRIAGGHYFDTAATTHPNRRSVEWLKTNIPRSDLPVTALNEIGAAITLFEVRRHKEVIESLLQGVLPDQKPRDGDEEELIDEPNAQRVETYSRDFVEGILRGMEPEQFENLVAGVFRAMGYHADVTQLSGDGGVDVLVSRDPLRLQPPTIKVQVKRTTTSIGGPAVQALIGTLAPGGSELALFVTLGNYSSDATRIARTRQDIRLLSGAEFIDLVFEYYSKLDAEWKRLIPLRLVHAVDRDL